MMNKVFLMLAIVSYAVAQKPLTTKDGRKIVKKKRKYTHDFSTYCPNAPTKEATKCLRNYKVAKYVS